jgi:uncharacterized protein (TIGR01244 family)
MSFGIRVDEKLYSSGQPSLTEFKELPGMGVQRIIDLRPPSEDHGFDEQKEAAAQHLDYCNLPIGGEKDLTVANVRHFDRLLGGPQLPMTLIHCGSGNRVGALFALREAWCRGQPLEAALAVGRHAGLKGLEPAVRAAITSQPQHAVAAT